MILKASQRSGSRSLAAHLLNARDNDHVEVYDIRGLVADDDLTAAFVEIAAQASGTNARKPLFSVSFNPPQEAGATYGEFDDAIARVEKEFGLESQARAIVFHEKEGRRHAHVVWSLIDTDRNRALEVKFFKNRLRGISRELYLDHGWTLPEGLKKGGQARAENYSMAEARQAERTGLDPEAFKRMLRQVLEQSDTRQSFQAALREKGLYLARGRKGHVVIDGQGEIYSLSRETGHKKKALVARLGAAEELPTVEQVQSVLQEQQHQRLQQNIAALKQRQARERAALGQAMKEQREQHREQRRELLQRQGERRGWEERRRAERYRGGIVGFFDRIMGGQARTEKRNAREREAGRQRDLGERQAMNAYQRQERQELHQQLSRIDDRHAAALDALTTGIMRDTTDRGASLQEAFARNQQQAERSKGKEQDTGRKMERTPKP